MLDRHADNLDAAANRDDPDHEPCRVLLVELTDAAVVPTLVIAEASYLIARELARLSRRRFCVRSRLTVTAWSRRPGVTSFAPRT